MGSPDDAGQANDALPGAVDSDGNPIDLQRKQLKSLGSLPRRCECTEGEHLEVSDIRQLSDDWMGGGTAENKKGFSNMLWSFGQFIDHDIVGVPSVHRLFRFHVYVLQLAVCVECVCIFDHIECLSTLRICTVMAAIPGLYATTNSCPSRVLSHTVD